MAIAQQAWRRMSATPLIATILELRDIGISKESWGQSDPPSPRGW